MALHRILVVDDSPAVRETLSILLGADHEVESASPAEIAAQGVARVPALIIATRDLAGAAGIGAHLPPGVPVLWLEPGLGSTPTAGGSPRLSPRRLRSQVAALLAAPPPAPAGLARLAPPFVPAAVARVALEALRTPLPLHLLGEPGVGKRALARAIHAAAAGSGEFVAVTGGAFDLAAVSAAAPNGGTVFIDRVEHLASAAQHALLAALDASGRLPLAADRCLRVISAATEDLDAAVERGTFLPDLYYRLTIFSTRLPALRERPDDVPLIALAIAAELATALGRSAVTLSEAAQTRLRHYLWFGNLAELEAVVARSIALAPGAVLDADDLRFEPQRVAPAPAAGAAGNGHDAFATQSLDLIINELAHEFKNPLVTIKTFAHHLRRTRPDGAEDAQVARLTGEAVEQIDQTLENLLEFTRLDSPAARSLPLSSVLDPVLADCSRALGARGVRLDHEAMPGIGVRGDPQQLAYALSNLVRSVSRDLPAGARVRIAYAPPASMTVELPNGSAPFGSHLATLLDRPADAAHAMPLGVAIANAVLERNGAQVAVADETPSIISVRFSLAGAEETAPANGSAPRIGR